MITRSIPATLQGIGPISATLTWDPKCPVRVTAVFRPAGHEPVEWMWALDLLRIGVVTVTPNVCGHGDVQITADLGTVVVSVRSPEGTASISLDYAATCAFRDEVTLANLTEEASMLALVDEFLTELNQESF
jgi:hypothetical protein